jgi:hypothetical protein
VREFASEVEFAVGSLTFTYLPALIGFTTLIGLICWFSWSGHGWMDGSVDNGGTHVMDMYICPHVRFVGVYGPP